MARTLSSTRSATRDGLRRWRLVGKRARKASTTLSGRRRSCQSAQKRRSWSTSARCDAMALHASAGIAATKERRIDFFVGSPSRYATKKKKILAFIVIVTKSRHADPVRSQVIQVSRRLHRRSRRRGRRAAAAMTQLFLAVEKEQNAKVVGKALYGVSCAWLAGYCVLEGLANPNAAFKTIMVVEFLAIGLVAGFVLQD